MKIKALFIVNIVITLAMFIGNYFYQSLGFSYPIKLMCSSGFALMGILNLVYALAKKISKNKVLIFMALGLIFAFAGDVVINLSFIPGTAIFAMGHVFFVIAYLTYREMNKLDIGLSLAIAIFAVCFIMFVPILIFHPEVLRYVCLVYGIIISIMVGKALGNAIRDKSLFTGMIAVASVLFFLSDFMLLLAWFAETDRWTSNVCMAAYYPGLCMLAMSMVIYIRDKEFSSNAI